MNALPTLTPPRVLERIRIDDADWQTYERFLAAVGDRRLRVTYDRGRLELMAPLRIHEREKRVLGRCVETLTLILNWPLESCGSMTIRREDLARGFEPDECYYVAHALQMMELREPDFTTDPPPDLAIETDVTSSSLDRLALYGALGIPEVWRFDGTLTFLHLQPDGTYQPMEVSRSFPFLRRADIDHFLALVGQQSETAILRAFADWVRETILPTRPTPEAGSV